MTDVKVPTTAQQFALARIQRFISVLKQGVTEDVPFKHIKQLAGKFSPVPKPEEKKLEAFTMCLIDELSFLFDFYQAYFEELLNHTLTQDELPLFFQDLYATLDCLIELEEKVGTLVAKSDDGEGEDAYDDESEAEIEPAKPKKKVQIDITEEKKETKKKPATKRKTKAKAKDDDDE